MALDEEDSSYSATKILDENESNEILMNNTETRKFSDSILPSSTNANSDMSAPQKKVKSSRRSSLGLGLLIGNNKSDSNKNGGKRRSSLAAILGRRNSKVGLIIRDFTIFSLKKSKFKKIQSTVKGSFSK
jgi:hypothetical protein